MEIPGNLHLLIFVAVCVLFTTTECATRIVNCPDGNLTIYVGTEGNLTCEGYSVAQITWEFKSGQSSYSTIGRCTSSSTCDLEPTFNTIFDLTPISGVSSWLNLTTKFTSSPKNATFSCDGEECFVIIDEPPTTPVVTTRSEESSSSPPVVTTGSEESSSSPPVVTTGSEESSSSPPDTPADTETSLTMSNNTNTTPADSSTQSTQSPTPTEGQEENATNRNDSPHKHVAAYVGGGFVGLVVIIVVVAVVVLRMRSSKKKAGATTSDQATNGATSARGRADPGQDTRM